MRPDGTKTYFWPDFWVYGDGSVEIKGFEHERGMAKLSLFREQHPAEPIRLAGASEYAQVARSVAHHIPMWEVTPFNVDRKTKRKPNEAPEGTARKLAAPDR